MPILRVLGWFVVAPALTAGVVMSALRLLQPDVGWAIRLVSFTPYALLSYAVALLAALVLLRRGVRTGAMALAIAGLALHAWWLAPLWTGTNPPAAADAEPFTVMSANLLQGEADPYAVVEAVSEHGVDVLVLNEVTPGAVAIMDSSGLSELLPHRAGRPLDGVEGTMLLSSYPLSGERALATGFEACAVDLDVDGTAVRALAVHPRAPIDDAAHWRADLAVVSEEAGAADLVLGDFNTTLDHSRFGDVLGDRLRDAVEATNSGWLPTWPINGTWILPGPLVQIDHVLTGGALAALTAERIEVDGTDHAFVVADVALR